MRRRLILGATGLAAAVTVGLYQLSYEVQRLAAELDAVNRDLLADQDSIHVLRAEWSYLTRPESLERLAARHLDLVPMAPDQVVTSLRTLPAKGAFGGQPGGDVPRPIARPALVRQSGGRT